MQNNMVLYKNTLLTKNCPIENNLNVILVIEQCLRPVIDMLNFETIIFQVVFRRWERNDVTEVISTMAKMGDHAVSILSCLFSVFTTSQFMCSFLWLIHI